MHRHLRAFALLSLALLLVAPRSSYAQEGGAVALAQLVDGLGTSARVLVIGAHPDDEDTRLITWLARGRHVQTAYLSLTRGDGGQNLIGNELGEALGAIRTEELLAARRIDGAEQFFTRAYDFGFSKTADETYKHWPHDTLLGDVVRVVRAFRPHVIVAVFSGTPQDGHGHHQVSGILAREAFDAAADSVRFPARLFGAAWSTLEFYRGRTYWGNQGATYRYNSGEYSPLLGRSYAEIAAESRSQHRSQAFGSLQPKGAMAGSVKLEASRVRTVATETQQSLFEGIDTTIARIAPALRCPGVRAGFDSIAPLIDSVRRTLDVRDPRAVVRPLARITSLAQRGWSAGGPGVHDRCEARDDDAASSMATLAARSQAALLNATGVVVEATVPNEIAALGDTVPITVTVYNRGPWTIAFFPERMRDSIVIRPDSSYQYRVDQVFSARRDITSPWWLRAPRRGDLFALAPDEPARIGMPEAQLAGGPRISTRLGVADARVTVTVPVVRRWADPSIGERRAPLAIAPAISVTLDQEVAYAPARTPIDRQVRVTLLSASMRARRAVVRLELPAGLTADSASRTLDLAGYDARATASFRVLGQLPAGRHRIAAIVESDGARFTDGYVEIAYEHIRPQRLYRQAVTELQAVDVAIPKGLTVAYIPGVGDNVAPMLEQLGIPLTIVDPDSVASADLSAYRTVVVGPRAYESHPALAAANGRLLAWAREGGTLVVQYQQDIAKTGLAPFPLTMSRPAERVTEEDAPVTILDPTARVLTSPNRITAADFAGWVQERATYMPSTFDPAYKPVLAIADPGMAPNRAGILVAPLGRGSYVLATLAFFRQLPAGNPGAARLFVNLLTPSASPTAAVVP